MPRFLILTYANGKEIWRVMSEQVVNEAYSGTVRREEERSRIVEIDRTFHQAKPQHLGVEIEIPLWIRSDRRHMTYSGNGFFHLPSSLFRPFDPLPDMRKPSTFWIRPEAVLVDFPRLDLRF